jgi:hypothetical protein
MAGLRYVMSMTLSTPWDLGSTTSDNSGTGFTNAYLNLGWVYGHTITGMDFNSTGTSLTMVYGNNASDKYIIEHPIDSAWNVSNATVLGAAPSIKYQQNTIQGLAYANNGNTLISVLDTGDTVYTYDTSFNGVNNNITDSSSNNHSITVNGDAHAGTFSPYRSGGYSLKFNGTANNYIRVESWQRANLGTNDFTVECFVYPTDISSRICDLLPGNAGLFRLSTFTGGNLALDINKQGVGSFDIRTTGGNINYNAWNHVAVCRSGTSLKLYSNGSLIHTETGGDWDYGTGDAYSNIGRWNTTGDVLNGYISNFRVKNSALYTGSTYTVPTEDFTSDAGTTLLVGAGALIDNVTPYGVVMYGVVTSEPFSPYDYLEYSATDHGGSVYFGGGTREHLSTSLPAFGTQDFEVEFWIYGGALTSNTWYTLFSRDYNVNGSFRIYCAGGSDVDKFIYIANGTEYNYTSAGKIRDNVWNHILLSRVSGTAKWFINGIEDTSWSDSENMTSTATLYIGDTGADETSNSSYPFVGYMSDIAIRMGGSGYRTSSFVPPTTSLSSTGAELHIKGTDASIIDKSQRYNIDLGSTSIVGHSTTKWSGETSIFINSNSNNADLITLPAGVLDASKPFTIEMWLKTLSGSTSGFWSIYTDATNLMRLRMRSDDRLEFYHRSGSYEQEILDATNTYLLNNTDFYHVAVTRDANSVFYLHQNGIKLGNFTASANYNSSAAPFIIGKSQPATERYMQGYIQDFRITQGLARYTAADETSNIPSAPLEG